MLSLRQKIIIAAVAVVAFIAIITAVFACNSSSNSGGNGGGPKPNVNANTYTVTFDAGGGTINGEYSYRVEIEKNTTVARPSEIPFRSGYIFWGWNTTGHESSPMWKFDTEKITKNMTIYAVWVMECTVTFHAEGGTFDDGDYKRTVTVAYNTKVNTPKVTPPDEYMELQYWTNGFGTEYDLSDNIYGDVDLYAKWDIKKDIKRQLAPFRYARNAFGYTVTGVVDNSVSALTVPSVVTSIDPKAFSNCYNLVSVTMHDGVDYIGQYAFQNCEKLKSVTLPSSLEGIEEYTFDGCTALESIRLPDTVTEIGYHAFSGCTALKSIEIPSGVTVINYSTFDGCTALESIRLPDTVTKIDSSTFRDCAALADIKIPAALEELYGGAFRGCSSLKSIIIPATCKVMESGVFTDCTGLTSVELH
ncbi:MAG: leucine-rich repeat protein, partial [Clostridiales bacterium]|nr:leucine-rich repeat protein [Clostridiales bacterium]